MTETPGGYPSPPPPGQYVPDHPRATLSLVLGILSLVVCQLIGPFAWVIGKRTVDEIDAAPGRYSGRGVAQAGYILGIVATVLLCAGLALVAFLLLVPAALGGFIFSR